MRRGTRSHYLKHREDARGLVRERLEHYNHVYGYRYQKIFIRNTRSRWGSCSSKGNLNFNYKIALLPGELADYIVVHELCHLREFNHSPKFWGLVAQTVPHYKELRGRLRRIR
jgi:predicted metal-dependent hydrolase